MIIKMNYCCFSNRIELTFHISFQLYMVVGANALLTCHLHIRRGAKVLAAQVPRGVGGAGDLLLTYSSRLQHLSSVIYRSARKSGICEEDIAISNTEKCNSKDKPSLVCLTQECPLSSSPASCRFSSLRPASFYLHNDFACSSNNKWLRRFIPVR